MSADLLWCRRKTRGKVRFYRSIIKNGGKIASRHYCGTRWSLCISNKQQIAHRAEEWQKQTRTLTTTYKAHTMVYKTYFRRSAVSLAYTSKCTCTRLNIRLWRVFIRCAVLAGLDHTNAGSQIVTQFRQGKIIARLSHEIPNFQFSYSGWKMAR